MIDGFPIDVEQADAFVRDIGEPTAVIFFEANDHVLKDRLMARYSVVQAALCDTIATP